MGIRNDVTSLKYLHLGLTASSQEDVGSPVESRHLLWSPKQDISLLTETIIIVIYFKVYDYAIIIHTSYIDY